MATRRLRRGKSSMRIRDRFFVGGIAAILFTLSASAADAQSSKLLAVVRVGDGTAPLSNQSTPVFVEIYSTVLEIGEPRLILLIPTAVDGANAPLTLAGNATSE